MPSKQSAKNKTPKTPEKGCLFSSSQLLAAARGSCKARRGCSPQSLPSPRLDGALVVRALVVVRHRPTSARSPSLPPFDVAAAFTGGRNHGGDVRHSGGEMGAAKGSVGACGTRDARGHRPSRPHGARARLLATRTAFFFLFFSFLSFPPSITRAILSQQRPGWAVGSTLHTLVPQHCPSHASCRGHARCVSPPDPCVFPAPRFAPHPCFSPPQAGVQRLGGVGRKPLGFPSCWGPLRVLGEF